MKVLDIDGLNYYNSLLEDKYALQSQLNNYLPLSGGTMTGAISMPQDGIICSSVDNSVVYFRGGTTWDKGAWVGLWGKDATNNAGAFGIHAHNGVNDMALIGRPNGTLTWNENNVITSAGGTMTGGIVLDTPSTNSPIIIKLPQFQHNTYRSIKVVDSSSNDIGSIYISSDNDNQRNTLAFNLVPYGTNLSARGLEIVGWQNGDVYCYVDPPPSGDNTNKIATTSFVNAKTGNYLPLSGGTMTGDIKRSGGGISCTGDTGWTRMNGGTAYDNGGVLTLWGKSHSNNAGQFSLKADNGSNAIILNGKPNGSLTWGGDAVLTDATVGVYTSKDISSSVSLAASTAKNITSVSLAAGRWLVIGSAYFTSITADKIYGIQVSATSGNYSYANSGSVAQHSAHTGSMSLHTNHIFSLSSTTTIYLTGYSTAASTVNSAVIQAVRIV